MVCSEHMSRPTMKCKQFISVKTAFQEIATKTGNLLSVRGFSCSPSFCRKRKTSKQLRSNLAYPRPMFEFVRQSQHERRTPPYPPSFILRDLHPSDVIPSNQLHPQLQTPKPTSPTKPNHQNGQGWYVRFSVSLLRYPAMRHWFLVTMRCGFTLGWTHGSRVLKGRSSVMETPCKRGEGGKACKKQEHAHNPCGHAEGVCSLYFPAVLLSRGHCSFPSRAYHQTQAGFRRACRITDTLGTSFVVLICAAIPITCYSVYYLMEIANK